MKTCIKNLFLVPGLIVALGVILAGRVTAQTFTTLHSFTAFVPGPYFGTNSDGAYPTAGLVLSGNTLYGTAYSGGITKENGGTSDDGTVFRINSDRTGFTNLHSFRGAPGDGANPGAGLILSVATEIVPLRI